MYQSMGKASLVLALLILPMTAASQTESTKEEKETGTESGESTEGTAAEETVVEEDSDKQPGAEQPSAASESKVDKGPYVVRLRDLEDRVNRLKEKIFRSKARLSLLAETVLDRKIAGSKLAVVFRNEMGGSYQLTKAIFLLDGGPIFSKSDEGGTLSGREIIDLFDGPVMPGDHTLSVVLHYRGHGYGIFSYLKGYKFTTRSSRTFTVGEGKALKLDVVGYEKGGVTTALEERPAVRYVEGLADYEGAAIDNEGQD